MARKNRPCPSALCAFRNREHSIGVSDSETKPDTRIATPITTAPGSNQTPTGNFRIAEKVGDEAPAGMIFESRVPTGKFGKPDDTEDRVQTRILWLECTDPDNTHTKDRYIYIHGTNAEHHLGIPASHGCVRMANEDVIDLYARVEVGTPMVIEA